MWILAYLEKEVTTVVHKASMGTCKFHEFHWENHNGNFFPF